MSKVFKEPFRSIQSPPAGLLAFLNIWILVEYAVSPRPKSQGRNGIQAGLPTSLNLYPNLPIVFWQGRSGHAHKAVAYLTDTSRFCVFRRIRPRARGSDRFIRPPSG